MYSIWRVEPKYACYVEVNGRRYQTDIEYESAFLAQENAAMRAFMVCRNFSVNGTMLLRNGVVQGLPTRESSLRRRHRAGRNSARIHAIADTKTSDTKSDDTETDDTESDHTEIVDNKTETESTVRPDCSTSAVSRGHAPNRKQYTMSGHLVGVAIEIEGHRVFATADTGSDANCIREEFAKEIGLRVDRTEKPNLTFQLANGRETTAVGTVSTSFCFGSFKGSLWSNDTNKTSILFHVFTSLAARVIIGKDTLQHTKTLTDHFKRLVLFDEDNPQLSIPQVLHMNRPSQRFRCYLGTELIYANVDTGS